MPTDNENVYYHVSPRANRESIQEDKGLRPQKQRGWGPKGVFMMPDAPNGSYGEDIYEVRPSSKSRILQGNMDPGEVYSPRIIPHSDFKRAGHVYSDETGSEIHWHPEENCKGRLTTPHASSWMNIDVDTKGLD